MGQSLGWVEMTPKTSSSHQQAHFPNGEKQDYASICLLQIQPWPGPGPISLGRQIEIISMRELFPFHIWWSNSIAAQVHSKAALRVYLVWRTYQVMWEQRLGKTLLFFLYSRWTSAGRFMSHFVWGREVSHRRWKLDFVFVFHKEMWLSALPNLVSSIVLPH